MIEALFEWNASGVKNLLDGEILMRRDIIEPGTRFGKLVVVSEAGARSGKAASLCKCDCGNECVAVNRRLRQTKQCCGCQRRHRKHGLSAYPEYSTWEGMWQRCTNQNAFKYDRYGGRGIQVCDRWRSFDLFIQDMGRRPSNMTLDRIDNDGNYEPSNCRWTSRQSQSNNLSNNRLVTANGRTQTVAQWAREINVKHSTIWTRLERGWSDQDAVYGRKRMSNAQSK